MIVIKNIIFDQGGILLNIDYILTRRAFEELGAFQFHEVYSQEQQNPLFDQYDTGEITSQQFRDGLKQLLQIEHVTDAAFDNAWNAMLLDIPIGRLTYILTELKSKYFVCILSNANFIHMDCAEKIFQAATGNKSLAQFFHKIYYSHLIGYRKPAREAYLTVLNENDLVASETLFIDDSKQHVEGARRIGINTLYLRDKCVTEVLPEILLGENG